MSEREKAEKRVIEAAKAWRVVNPYDHDELLKVVRGLEQALDALARLESDTQVSHPPANDTLPAPSDVCPNCGRGICLCSVDEIRVNTRGCDPLDSETAKAIADSAALLKAAYEKPADVCEFCGLPDYEHVSGCKATIPADVCECGHGDADHGLSASGNGRCWHICACTKYRPKQKGGE